MYREKDSADFDLERFIDMFDEALTSRDERVVNALRSLMMMTILTKNETPTNVIQDKNAGPLRRLFDDVQHLNQRLSRVEQEQRYIANGSRPVAPESAKAFWGKESYRHTLAAAQRVGALEAQKDWDKNFAKSSITAGSLLPKIKKEGE